jgi:HEAT repeat protein
VAIEAACTLCRLEEAEDEAIELMKRAMDAPNSVAQDAVEAIPRLGEAGKSLIPIALSKLKSDNPYARYAAIGVVGTLEPSEAVKYLPDLARLATDVVPKSEEPKGDRRGQNSIRMRVGVVLEKLGPAAAPAAEALAKAISSEKDSAVREQFYDAIMAMGPEAKPAFQVLVKYASEPPPLERRKQVFEALVGIDPGAKEAAELFLQTTKDNSAASRALGAMMLAKLDPMPPDALARLVEMANKDTATAARSAALKALAAAGPKAKPVRADIEKIATGTIPEFALAAKTALAAIDGTLPAIAADVRKALSDKNAQVRAAAVESLLIIGPTATDLPTLQRMMSEPGAATREAAARCAGIVGKEARDAVPHLVKLLDDREASVRIAAATALGDIGWAPKSALAKLRAMRGGTKRGAVNDPLAGPAAAKALQKLEGKDPH